MPNRSADLIVDPTTTAVVLTLNTPTHAFGFSPQRMRAFVWAFNGLTRIFHELTLETLIALELVVFTIFVLDALNRHAKTAQLVARSEVIEIFTIVVAGAGNNAEAVLSLVRVANLWVRAIFIGGTLSVRIFLFALLIVADFARLTF